MEHILIAGGADDGGMYVVTDGADSKEIVSASLSPSEALDTAREAGARDPVLIYVPKDDERTIVL